MAWLKEVDGYFWMFEKTKREDGKWRARSWSTRIPVNPQGRVSANKICADYNNDRVRVKNGLEPIAKEAREQEFWWESLKRKLLQHIRDMKVETTRVKSVMALGYFETLLRPGGMTLSEFKAYPVADTYMSGRLAGEPGRRYSKLGIRKQPVSRATLRVEISYLSSLFKKAVEWSAQTGIEKNPFSNVKTGGERRKTMPKHLGLDMVSAFIAEARRRFGEDFGMMVEFFFYSGARLEEGRVMRREDVNLQMNTIRILGKGDKERIVPILWPPLRAALEKRMALQRHGYLFGREDGSAMPRNTIQKRFKAVGRAVGVPWVHAHTMRHSIATHLLDSGKATVRDVQEFLGHENMATTSVYTHAIGGSRMVGAVELPPAPTVEVIKMPQAATA